MANIPLKSIKFPDLANTYTVPSNAGELPYNKSATYPDDTVGKALQDKPDADGTIANAEQLTSNIYEEDSVPYNFRTSGGSIDIGDRETDMIVGGTVAWNQLFEALTASALDGITTNYDVNTHLISIINDSRTSNYSSGSFRGPVLSGVVGNHKYLYAFSQSMAGVVLVNVSGGVLPMVFNGSALPDTKVYLRITKDYDFVTAHPVGSVVKLYLNIFDLTAMFGSTIADYIYSLEQATAGAGVAWFKKLFPKPYYEYNAGELMSVNTSAHNTVGFNQFDKSTATDGKYVNSSGTEVVSSSYGHSDYIKVLPKTTYHMTGYGGSGIYAVLACDINKNPISTYYGGASKTEAFDCTLPSDCHYVILNYLVEQKDTVCFNLSWDGERDGEYEAYVKHSYALDSSLTLRGIPKLDANNNLYYDGDEYESDGTVTRKYGYKRFTNGEPSTNIYSVTVGTDKTRVVCNGDALPSAKSGAYLSFQSNAFVYDYNSNPDIGEGAINNGFLIFGAPATVTTKEEAVAYLANRNTEFVYELATPTTETADPYTNPQIVDDFGTEEYVDYAYSQSLRDASIPVGHCTQYMANLKAKLEMSPNSPDGAGDYIVRQSNGENEYVSLSSNATIQDIIARLEALENA